MTTTASATFTLPAGKADGSHLDDLERDILSKIPTGWSLTSKTQIDWMTDARTSAEKAAEWTPARLDHASAIVVYVGELGIEMGAVRCRFPAGYAGRTEDDFEVSPFPGGWGWVPISRILRVRHPVTI